ncbi:hypothetical protein M514_13478, partial [Trichuris suis]
EFGVFFFLKFVPFHGVEGWLRVYSKRKSIGGKKRKEQKARTKIGQRGPIDFLLEYTLNQSSTPWKGTNFRNKKIPNSTQEPQRIEDRRLQSYHNGQTTEHSNRTERTL